MIIIDDRELKSGISDELKKLKLPFEIKRLDVGDYIINNNIFIERKTTSDFIESMQDKRLFDQISRIRKNGKRALMIIEGKRLPGRPAILGSLCAITAKYYMPVLRSVNIKGTAGILKHLYNYESTDFHEKPYCTHDFRTKRGISSLQERMLMQLYRVGPKLARKLLNKFDSIGGILRANENELLEINGVGKMLLHEIRILRGQ